MIRGLFSWVSIRPNDIKICVSSREELIFQERFSRCPKIRLHELTRYDIAIYVQGTLQANEDFKSVNTSKEKLAKLQKQIIDKSEGVFLWVSLAVRTLEQRLLAEDRLEDLEKKIDALPPELGDLFDFIFDSITKRSHPIDCRNAIRTLATATRFPEWPSMPLMHYSFLEEYQDDQEFAINRRIHNLTDDDIRQRLRRARKQIYARCRGILEVVSRSAESVEYGIPFREETVKLTHRSLGEYLQKKAVHERMAPYLVDFDVLNFHCQALVAELKSVEPNLSKYFTSNFSGFELDLSACFRLFCDTQPDNSIRFCKFLDQLAIVVIARVPTGTLGSREVGFPESWSSQLRSMENVQISCHPSAHVRFYAVEYGVYEYLSTRPAIGVQVHQHGERDEILPLALHVVSDSPQFKISQDNLTKILGYCFEHGISANSKGGLLGKGTCWQRALWTLMATPPSWKAFHFEFEPIIRVFLLYGADPNFYLTFGSRHTSYNGKELIKVVPKIESEGIGLFDAVCIDANSEDIVGLAEEKGGTLSLREIVKYWFPKRYKVLQELIDRNVARQGYRQDGELEGLKGRSHMDLDVWKGLTYEKDKCLFPSFEAD
jgi:hypothetical protein